MMGLEVGLGLGLWPMPAVVLAGPAPTLAIRKEKIIIVVEECACAVCGGCGRVWRVEEVLGVSSGLCERVSDRRRAPKVGSGDSGVPRVSVRVTVARCGCGRPGTAGGAVRLAHLPGHVLFPTPRETNH